MVGRKRVIAAAAAVAAAYALYPCVTLYRLGQAIRQGDAATLEALVDWDQLREGIKEDICDQIMEPPAQEAADSLPPFGASFVRGIAATAIDSAVTPRGLLSVTQRPMEGLARPHKEKQPRIVWAFFDGPMRFHADLTAPGTGVRTPIRIQLELQDGFWKVTRVWLPPELLEKANART
ncbi:MAG: DUF2939 domain-containing protein [Acetobacteraceae bacterium]|nr:DUF2939 domain-containing protein [Acetobacteraceae bacterium]